MKERPIIFSGEMVRALLEGRKTQTRRVVKQPAQWRGRYDQLCTETLLNDAEVWWWDGVNERVGASQACPYGQPGDRLWVRETWGKVQMQHLMSPTPGRVEEAVTYRAGKRVLASRDRPESGKVSDWPASWTEDHQPSDGRWRPSIHMPRWACRLLLEVTAVRVERLHEISEADAEAEGAFFTDYGRRCHHYGPPRDASECPEPDKHHPQCPGWSMVPTDSHDQCLLSPSMAFANLWESINGASTWAANPWVWVVELQRVGAQEVAA